MAGNVVIFPGQGSQSVGMGRSVADLSAAARDIFDQADRILGFDLSRICFEGPESELMRTDIQQPAIFTTSVAIWAALLERRMSPTTWMSSAAGLSLGEYTALHVAGAFSFEDGLKLVRRRGELMQSAASAAPSGMVSIIGGGRDTVEALCKAASGGEVLAAANFNCPGQIVISGSLSACERAVGLAVEHGVRGIMLKVAGAFHSPFMESAAVELRAVLDDTSITAPSCPVLANVDASPHRDPESIRDALCRQVTHAVRWQDTIEKLIEQGHDRFVEVGPGRVLTGLMRKINRKMHTINVSDVSGVDVALAQSTASK